MRIRFLYNESRRDNWAITLIPFISIKYSRNYCVELNLCFLLWQLQLTFYLD